MRRIQKTNLLSVTLLCVAVGCETAMPAHGAAKPERKENQQMAVQGMNKLMDGDFDAAAETFRQIQKSDPDSPLGYLFEADENWWKIYLTEGDLVDPDVFEARTEAVTPYDSDFARAIDLAITKAEARIQAHQDEAFNYFYEGLAYGLRSRLEALRRPCPGHGAGGQEDAQSFSCRAETRSQPQRRLVWSWTLQLLRGYASDLCEDAALLDSAAGRRPGRRSPPNPAGNGKRATRDRGGEIPPRQELLPDFRSAVRQRLSTYFVRCSGNILTIRSGICLPEALSCAWGMSRTAKRSTEKSSIKLPIPNRTCGSPSTSRLRRLWHADQDNNV